MSVLDLLIPPACSGCGRYGEHLCGACRRSFRPASANGERFLTADPSVVIGDDLELALAAFAYEGVLRRAMARLKYGGAARLAGPLAEAALPTLNLLRPMLDAPALVPVPVHPDRLRQRGYNQARLLATTLSRSGGLPLADLLLRSRPTTQQHRLNRVQRLRNLRHAFTTRPGARSPPHVVLVDDILTTLATLEACSTVLRAAGATRVMGLAVAREI